MQRVSGVLLAAGRGTRFGADKRLQRLPGGDTLLTRSLGTLAAVADDVVVVLRPGDDELAERLARPGVYCRINPRADDGMGGSLALGVRECADADAWLVLPADLPLLRVATVRQVRAALTATRAVVPVCQGTRGHPVGFPRRFGSALVALHGEAGGRTLLRRDPDAVTWLNVDDPGIHRDLDTPADLEALSRRDGGVVTPEAARKPD